MTCAGFKVRRGIKAVRSGIAAVSARLETGRLRILEVRYDHGQERKAEKPLNEHNHALDALGYLVNPLDARPLAGRRPRPAEPTDTLEPMQPKANPRPWLRMDNEAL